MPLISIFHTIVVIVHIMILITMMIMRPLFITAITIQYYGDDDDDDDDAVPLQVGSTEARGGPKSFSSIDG